MCMKKVIVKIFKSISSVEDGRSGMIFEWIQSENTTQYVHYQ